jgi:hypothetical protein
MLPAAEDNTTYQMHFGHHGHHHWMRNEPWIQVGKD